MSEFDLPFHPVSGVQAIGIGKRGPIWPAMGGAPEDGAEDGDDAGSQDDSDTGDHGAEDATGAVTFATRADFVKAVNKIVKTRLDRNDKKYAPVVAERDTLKSKVDEWQPLIEGKQTEDQKRASRENAMQSQIDELLSYRKGNERNELVRRIAKDKGLPDEFLSRIHGDDEDAITADVEDFLDVLKLDASTKRTTVKNTKPESKDEGKGGKGAAGGSGSDHEESIDPKKLAASIGRYGRNPYVVG